MTAAPLIETPEEASRRCPAGAGVGGSTFTMTPGVEPERREPWRGLLRLPVQWSAPRLVRTSVEATV
jgi:hypothetical protein